MNAVDSDMRRYTKEPEFQFGDKVMARAGTNRWVKAVFSMEIRRDNDSILYKVYVNDPPHEVIAFECRKGWDDNE